MWHTGDSPWAAVLNLIAMPQRCAFLRRQPKPVHRGEDVEVRAQPRPTLAHVAKKANVSITTASAALRNSGRVSEATRRRVLEAAAAVGYRKNSGAVALRRGQSGMIGVLMETSAFEDNAANPKLFWPRLLNGLVERLTHAGMGMALVARSHPEPIAGLPVDALVLLTDPDGLLPIDIPYGMPVVGGLRRARNVTAWVAHDYEHIARTCVEHLIDRGARHVALVLTADSVPTDQLIIAALRRQLLPKVPVMTVEGDDASIHRALTSGADSVVTLGENLDGILRATRNLGLSVPSDVLLVSLSEGDRESRSIPPVTTLSFLGRRSGQALGDVIVEGLDAGTFTSVTLPFQFDLRDSTARS